MTKRKRTELYEHWRPYGVVLGIAVGVMTITVLYCTLPPALSKILLDHDPEGGGGRFPYSVQNAMWISFGVAMVELTIRFLTVRAEGSQLDASLLPEDETTVLVAEDLPTIYRQVKAGANSDRCFLPRLVQRCILQFQASRSIEQSASLLNTSLEMFLHEIDLRYSLLRYISWFIPSLGFIGTVIGIGHALAYAGEKGRFDDPELLTTVTSRLAVSFDGTLLALSLASVIVFLQTMIQSREEKILNLSGEYCLDNLINRLYVEPTVKQLAYVQKELA